MPRGNIDDFVDAIGYATRITGLHSQMVLYDDEFDESLTGFGGSQSLTSRFSNDWADRLISDVQAANPYIQTARKTDIGAIACEVCGEPTGDLRYHICQRCRAAAKKFKDCLTEEDVRNG